MSYQYQGYTEVYKQDTTAFPKDVFNMKDYNSYSKNGGMCVGLSILWQEYEKRQDDYIKIGQKLPEALKTEFFKLKGYHLQFMLKAAYEIQVKYSELNDHDKIKTDKSFVRLSENTYKDRDVKENLCKVEATIGIDKTLLGTGQGVGGNGHCIGVFKCLGNSSDGYYKVYDPNFGVTVRKLYNIQEVNEVVQVSMDEYTRKIHADRSWTVEGARNPTDEERQLVKEKIDSYVFLYENNQEQLKSLATKPDQVLNQLRKEDKINTEEKLQQGNVIFDGHKPYHGPTGMSRVIDRYRAAKAINQQDIDQKPKPEIPRSKSCPK